MMRTKTIAAVFGVLAFGIILVGKSTGEEIAAMFVMGDSLADAGNNNRLNTSSRADHAPYGQTFFHSPTGRFSNGRTVFDFLATKLGLPFAPPYLEKNANFSKGINFASGGSGLLDYTGCSLNIIPMSRQVEQMANYSVELESSMGKEASTEYLAKSIFLISIGGNDVGINYFQNQTFQLLTSPMDFVNLLIANYQKYLQRLYKIGARRIVVIDMGPVGCIPSVRAAAMYIYGGKCVGLANQIAIAYNSALRKVVLSLNKELKGATLVMANTFQFTLGVITNPAPYGFSETRRACCGSGVFNAEGYCNLNNAELSLCEHPEEYLFWDGTHPTERLYWLVFRQMWSGKRSFIFPVNLNQISTISLLKL